MKKFYPDLRHLEPMVRGCASLDQWVQANFHALNELYEVTVENNKLQAEILKELKTLNNRGKENE